MGEGKKKRKMGRAGRAYLCSRKTGIFFPVQICDFFVLTGNIFSVIWFDFYRGIVIILDVEKV